MESEDERLTRLLEQCEAMIAELKSRGASGDLEMAASLEQVRAGLEKQRAEFRQSNR